MKKLMLILAMGTFGYASVQATTSPLSYVSVEQPYQDDKVEIDEADLPQAVKDANENDGEVSDLEISEAFQVTKENDLYYKIKFMSVIFSSSTEDQDHPGVSNLQFE